MSVERTVHFDMQKFTRRTTQLTVGEVAAAVEGQAVYLVPKVTGTLASSIYRKETSPLTAEVGATAEYASAVEFGSEAGFNQRAQPYLRPALDSVRKRLSRIWVEQSRGV